MTFTFQFSVPYTVVGPESRLEAAQQEAAANASSSSDLSSETRQAIIDAIQAHLPGAAEFEIINEP